MPFTGVAPLVAVGLLGFGLLFLGIGLRTAAADRRRRETWRRHPGEVVASRLDDGQVRCQVAYRRDDGTRVLFWNRYTSTTLADPVGRAVLVLANPDDPHDAVVGDGLVGGAVVGVVLAVLGAVAALAGAGLGAALLV